MKIVILDSFASNPGDISWDDWNNLKADGADVELVLYDRTDKEQVIERAADAEIVLVNKVILGEEEISQLPKLKYIGVLATGYNVIDTEAARRHGIVVTNIPAYSTLSVAQMVFAHILNITNHVHVHSSAVNDGMWQNCNDFTFWVTPQIELMGQTLGIVGMGNTGTATARIALAFGMKVMAYTSKDEAKVKEILGVSADDGSVCKADNLDHLLSASDIVSLHCPLTPETHHIINASSIEKMKPSAILINTGRGPLVDENALASALQKDRICAAGVDVLTQEPPVNGSPLIGLSNCFLTPHIAWATKAARLRLQKIALDNIKVFLRGEKQNVVN